MNNDELITKARTHLRSILRNPLFKIGIEPEEFTKATRLETPAVVVRFNCGHREDVLDVVLNADTGDYISMNHIPQNPAADKPY